MLSLCGCDLDEHDTAVLIGRLEDDPTVISDEAAAAIRYAAESSLPADTLDLDLRDAIRHALRQGPLPLGLGALRDALDGGGCR